MMCGIDEAGRGALAGPLVIAGCELQGDILGLDDSKKLNEKKRESLYLQIIQNAKFLVIYFSNKQIDECGISACLRSALLTFKRYFKDKDILFDGNCSYGTGVKTLIKADAKVKEVSAASIIAKVSRDRLMNAYAKIYPDYGYAKHKGYGTKLHLRALKEHGVNELIRNSFKIKSKQVSLF